MIVTCRRVANICAPTRSMSRRFDSISVPYFGVQLLSSMIAKYHRYSKGQLPAILTPYKAASLWGGNRFDNSKLRSIGWKQLVPTAEGLQRTFAAFRTELDAARVKKTAMSAATDQSGRGFTGEVTPSLCEFVVGVASGPRFQWQFQSSAVHILESAQDRPACQAGCLCRKGYATIRR